LHPRAQRAASGARRRRLVVSFFHKCFFLGTIALKKERSRRAFFFQRYRRKEKTSEKRNIGPPGLATLRGAETTTKPTSGHSAKRRAELAGAASSFLSLYVFSSMNLHFMSNEIFA